MTLIDNRATNTCKFRDINLGQCFEWDGDIYIRVPLSIAEHDQYGGHFNAYAIAGTVRTDCVYLFRDDIIVEPVLATLTINTPSSAAGANDRE